MVLPQLSGNSRERRRSNEASQGQRDIQKKTVTGTAKHPEEDSNGNKGGSGERIESERRKTVVGLG
jgi:hypothetical protein